MDELTLTLELPSRVQVGFPVWAGVTVRNVSDGVSFSSVPSCTPFNPNAPLRLVFRSPTEGELVVEGTVDKFEGRLVGDYSGPGDVRRSTADLSAAIAQLEPGGWEVEATLLGTSEASAPPVRLDVGRAEPEDLAIATALASRNELGETGWPWLLLASPEPIAVEELEGLSAAGHRALRLWLFMHDATYGARPLGALDAGALDEIEGAPEAEVAVLRHEILCAQGAEFAQGLASAITERWPGLDESLDANRRGRGLLWTLRSEWGAAS